MIHKISMYPCPYSVSYKASLDPEVWLTYTCIPLHIDVHMNKAEEIPLNTWALVGTNLLKLIPVLVAEYSVSSLQEVLSLLTSEVPLSFKHLFMALVTVPAPFPPRTVKHKFPMLILPCILLHCLYSSSYTSMSSWFTFLANLDNSSKLNKISASLGWDWVQRTLILSFTCWICVPSLSLTSVVESCSFLRFPPFESWSLSVAFLELEVHVGQVALDLQSLLTSDLILDPANPVLLVVLFH